MKSVRGIEPPAGDIAALHFLLEFFHHVVRPGHERKHRRIDRGDGELLGQQRRQFFFRQAHGDHRATGQRLNQLRAARDHGQRFLQREDAGQARGHKFAQAVRHHGLRRHAPGEPQFRQRILDGKQRRLRDPCFEQQRLGLLNLAAGGENHLANIKTDLPDKNLRAPVDFRAEDRLGAVEFARPC